MQGVYRNQKVILHIFVLAAWIKIKNADSSLITASVGDKDSEELCVGTVDAKPGCWSFLKGGFVASKLNLSSIYLKVYLLVALSILTHTSSNLNLVLLMNTWKVYRTTFQVVSFLLQNSDQEDLEIEIASASLQPFTEEQWILNQQTKINMVNILSSAFLFHWIESSIPNEF